MQKNIDELFQIIEKIGKENAGIITTKQIEAAGIYRGLIKVFVEDGRLIKEVKGLYSLENEFPVKVVVGSQIGGVVGMNAAGGTIENSFHFRSDSWNVWPYEGLNEGYITASGASHVGSLVGQNDGAVANCYYVGNCNDEGTEFNCQVGEEKSEEQFKSGEVCYLLNNDVTDGSQAYYQDLTGGIVVGGEPLKYPSLVKEVGTVYASSPCAIHFSNHSDDEKITTELPHVITSPWDKETHTVICDACQMTVRDEDTPEFDPTYKEKESGEPITEFLDTVFSNRSVEVTVAVSDPKKDPNRMVVPSGIDRERGATYQIGSNGTKEKAVLTDNDGVLTFNFDVSGPFDDTLYFTAYDQVGCEGVKESHVVIETDAPGITDQSNYGTKWIDKETLTVGAKDTGSGLRKITYTVDDSSEVHSLFEATDEDGGITTQKDVGISLVEESHTYHISATDNCGNTATKDIVVNMDKTGPVIDKAGAEAADILDTSAKITVSASDNRGIEGYYLVSSDGEITATAEQIAVPANKKTVTEGKIAINGLHANREYHFALVAKDTLGNLSVVKSGTFLTAKTDLEAATVTLGTTSYTYDGTAKTPEVTVKLGGTTIDPGQYEISYSNSVEGSEAANVRAGTVTVTVKAKDTGDYKGTVTQQPTFTIKKVASTVQVPTAKSGLTYNGSAQDLVNPGSATGGAVKYSTSQTGEYSDAIPTGIDAKEYSVWYKVVGDANHTDMEPVEIKVTIDKFDITGKEPTITLGEALTYTGTEQTQMVSSVTCNTSSGNNDTSLPVTFAVIDNKETDAGNYTLTVIGTGNFTGRATKGFSIEKSTYSQTAKKDIYLAQNETGTKTLTATDLFGTDVPAGATIKAYTKTADKNAIISGGSIVENGVFSYTPAVSADRLDDEATYEFTVSSKNYEDFTVMVTFQVKKKNTVSITGVSVDNKTYDGKAMSYTGTPSALWNGTSVSVAFTCTWQKNTGGDTWETISEAPVNAGKYRLIVAVADSEPEYKGSLAPMEFTIEKKPVYVNALDQVIKQGDKVHISITDDNKEPVVFYEGFVGTDTAADLVNETETKVSVKAKDGTTFEDNHTYEEGSYVIEAENIGALNAFEPAKNYKLEKGKNGVLLVTAKKSQNENAEKIYGEDSGTLDSVAIVETGAPAAKMDTISVDNIKNLLTEDEATAVKGNSNTNTAGKDALLYLKLSDVGEKATKQERDAIESKMKSEVAQDAKVGKYLDVSLFLKIARTSNRQITDTSGTKLGEKNGFKVKVNIDIPSDLPRLKTGYSRTYKIIRAHNENGNLETEALNTTKTGNQLMFETDKFSIYAITYKDTQTSSGSNTDDGSSSGGSGSPSGGGSSSGGGGGISNVPVVSDKPTVPTETDQPSVPTETEKPLVIIPTAPVKTENPTMTATPIVSTAPTVTDTPVAPTATPEEQTTPVVTATPEVTTAPAVTATPEVTTAPAVPTPIVEPTAPAETDTPKDTTTPKVTATPKPTATPKKVTSDFGTLKARSDKQTNTTVTLKWSKVSKADGYLIYGSKCNTKGKKYTNQLLKTIKGNKTLSWTQKKLKKATGYKYQIKAYRLVKGKKVVIAQSVGVYTITKGGKYCVADAIKVPKLAGKKVSTKSLKLTLKKGKTAQITAAETPAEKKKSIKRYRGLCYESSNSKVATVTKSGKIKAVKKGTCKIYVYAQNGVYKTIIVTVK